MYRRLLALRERVLSDRGQLIHDAAVAVDPNGTHLADSGTDEFERDLEFALLAATQDTFFEIEAALRRIERGTYGVCEMTGEPIPEARLEAIPWARFTADAERRWEAQDGMVKPHLGEFRRVELGPGEAPQALGNIWSGEAGTVGAAAHRETEADQTVPDQEFTSLPVRETHNRNSP